MGDGDEDEGRDIGVNGRSGVGEGVRLEESTELGHENVRDDRLLARHVSVAISCRDGNGVVELGDGFGLDEDEATGREPSNHRDVLTWRPVTRLLPSEPRLEVSVSGPLRTAVHGLLRVGCGARCRVSSEVEEGVPGTELTTIPTIVSARNGGNAFIFQHRLIDDATTC